MYLRQILMGNSELLRMFPEMQKVQDENIATSKAPDYKVGEYDVNFFSNLKDVLGETLWNTYERTNTLTGGALEKAVYDSYFNVNVSSGDYNLQLERNAFIDDMKQDYKLTLSKRF
jgi:hypothetical protein